MKVNFKKVALGMMLGISMISLAACGSSDSGSKGDGVAFDSEINGKTYTVEFDKTPERAVSLAGFSTEIMLDLGLEDQMAGYAYQDNPVTEEYTDAIAKVKELSKENPSPEVLLNEKPDFLTGWASSFGEKRFTPEFCKDNNIKFYLPRVEYDGATMETVYEDYMNIGKIFGVEDVAKEKVEKMKSDIAAIHDKVKDEEKVRVFIYDSGEETPFTAGKSLPTDMIRLAGGENVFGKEKQKWLDVSWEKVIEADPEWIIVMKYDASDDADAKVELLKSHPALQNVTAVKNGNIFVMGLSDVLAGPRDVKAIQTMAEHFHPEAFQ